MDIDFCPECVSATKRLHPELWEMIDPYDDFEKQLDQQFKGSCLFVGAIDIGHRNCAKQLISNWSPLIYRPREVSKILSTDVDMLSHWIEFHPEWRRDSKDQWKRIAVNWNTMSVDVYRFLTQSFKDNFSEEAPKEWMVSAASMGNAPVTKYIIDARPDARLDKNDLWAFQFTLGYEGGAEIFEVLCDRGVCDRSLIVNMANDAGRLKTEDFRVYSMSKETFDKNMAELLSKNYICNDEICYQIQANPFHA